MKRNLAIVHELPRRPAGPQQELELYRRIFNSAKDAIAIIDPEGRYVQQNPAHEALIGYSDAELHGETPAIHMGEAGFARVAEGLRRKGYFEGELESRTKSGERVILELSAFSMLDHNGRVLYHVGVKRNV